MHSRLTLALVICIAAPGFAYAAPKNDTKKFDFDCTDTPLDGSYIETFDNGFLVSNQETIINFEILGFALGRDSILQDFYTHTKGKDFNADVMRLKKLSKQKAARSVMDADYNRAVDQLNVLLEQRKLTKSMVKLVSCRVAAIGSASPNPYNAYATSYLKDLQAKQEAMNGQVGYFDVTVNDCTITKSIDTGNRFTALKPDPDARYLTVNATFKNTDNEGRLPLEGSLIISKDGKDYKFDTTESILSDGYGIRLRSLNPFIKLNTKIVYKVPNELSGDVYWKPGRNAEDKKLWCTYLPSV